MPPHPGRPLHPRPPAPWPRPQIDLMSVVEGLAARQDAILQRLDALGAQVSDAEERAAYANNKIAMAWL